MTPNLKYREYVLNKLVSDLEGFVVYYNPQFKSWWWIKPETKEWRFEFKKTGSLYWYYGWGDNFKMKYSLDDSEFEEIISRYVEHTIQNGVVDTIGYPTICPGPVEHTLQNGVVNTWRLGGSNEACVEDTLRSGVFHTAHLCSPLGDRVEHTLENGVTNNIGLKHQRKLLIEETISKESECTFNVNYTLRHGFENEPR